MACPITCEVAKFATKTNGMEVENGCISNSSYLSKTAMYSTSMIMGERVTNMFFMCMLYHFFDDPIDKNRLDKIERSWEAPTKNDPKKHCRE